VKSIQAIQVAHAIKPSFGFPTSDRPEPKYPDGFQMVAIVEWREDYTLDENLNMAFQLTNHIGCPWWENPGVTALGPFPFKHRSSSVGDLISVPDGRLFQAAPLGWKELVNEHQ